MALRVKNRRLRLKRRKNFYNYKSNKHLFNKNKWNSTAKVRKDLSLIISKFSKNLGVRFADVKKVFNANSLVLDVRKAGKKVSVKNRGFFLNFFDIVMYILDFITTRHNTAYIYIHNLFKYFYLKFVYIFNPFVFNVYRQSRWDRLSERQVKQFSRYHPMVYVFSSFFYDMFFTIFYSDRLKYVYFFNNFGFFDSLDVRFLHDKLWDGLNFRFVLKVKDVKNLKLKLNFFSFKLADMFRSNLFILIPFFKHNFFWLKFFFNISSTFMKQNTANFALLKSPFVNKKAGINFKEYEYKVFVTFNFSFFFKSCFYWLNNEFLASTFLLNDLWKFFFSSVSYYFEQFFEGEFFTVKLNV